MDGHLVLTISLVFIVALGLAWLVGRQAGRHAIKTELQQVIVDLKEQQAITLDQLTHDLKQHS
jgi:hypothetical protein